MGFCLTMCHTQSMIKFIKLKSLFFLLSLSTASFGWSNHQVECKDSDIYLSDFIGASAQKDIAGYEYGLAIQDAFREEDIQKLLNLIKIPLEQGPRIKAMATSSFKDIFDQDVIDSVLGSPPSCKGFDYNSWMLGAGYVWYGFYGSYSPQNTQFSIQSLTKTKAIEIIDLNSSGWFHEGKLIHPETFIKMSISGDFFEDIAQQQKINDSEDFYSNPGKYFGTKIYLSDTIKNSWNGNDLLLSVPLGYFADKNPSNGEFNNDLQTCAKLETGSRGETCYSLIAEVSKNHCQNLAPNLDAVCKEAFLIEVSDWGGGSLGFQSSAGIYGLFEKKKIFYIVPLKYLANRNEGLNYLDTLQ